MDNNETTTLIRSPAYLYIRGIGSIVLCILALVTNITALVLLVRLTNLRNTQILLVFNMCLINIVNAAFVQPVFGYMQLTGPLTPDAWCQLHGFYTNTVGGCLLVSLFLITLHRYFIVLFPNSTKINMGSGKKTVCIIAVCYTLVHFINLFPLFRVGGSYGYDETLCSCGLLREGSRTYYVIVLIMGVIIPLLLKFIAYTHIFITVYKQRKKITAMSDKLAKKRQKSEIRLTVVSCILVLIFIASYMPYFIASSSAALERNDYFHAIASMLLLLHCIVNPIVYLYGDGKIRSNIGKLVSRQIIDKDQVTSLSVQS